MALSRLSGARYPLGEYRDLVTVQAKLTAGSDEYTDVMPNIWARVVALSGYERIQAAQLETTIDYRVAIPGCPLPIEAATMRLIWHTNPTRSPVVLQIQAPVIGVLETVCDCVEAHP